MGESGTDELAHGACAHGQHAAREPWPVMRRLVLTYIAIAFFVSATVTLLLMSTGNNFVDAVTRTPIGAPVTLAQPTNSDSWMPMLKTLERMKTDPEGGLYAVFRNGEWKFQYPPIAILIAEAVPEAMAAEARADWILSSLARWNNWFCRAMIALTLSISAAILIQSQRRYGSGRQPLRTEWLMAGAVMLLGITYMPILGGYLLGQFQLACNALVALAILLFIQSRRLAAGVVIGLFCLIKPQLALVGLWALFRREYRLAIGIALVGVPGVLLSVALYGFQSLIDYVGVLQTLSRQSEAFFYNQSLAGILLRFRDPELSIFLLPMGSPLPPYVGWIHQISTVHTGLLILLALVIRSKTPGTAARLVDFCTIITVATVASPVAWNHHFGALFPVLVAIAPLIIAMPRGAVPLTLLSLAWLAIGAAVIMPDALYHSRWTGLLGEQMFVGGQILVALLLLIQLRAHPIGLDLPRFAAGLSGRRWSAEATCPRTSTPAGN